MRLDFLANAWHSEDATDLGQAIASYLSADAQPGASVLQVEEQEEVSEEVLRLRCENSRLRDCIGDFEEELAHLRASNTSVFAA